MRVLVCGGRGYKNKRRMFEELDAYQAELGPLTIIEGGASGADRLAFEWAQARQRPVITHFADWATLGKKAGPIRNKEMLEMWEPHLVLAFPGGRGTENMKLQAEKHRRSIKVEVVFED